MQTFCFELTPERSVRRLCRDLAAREIRPLAPAVDVADHQMRWDLWQKASEVGLTTFMIPSEYGGGGVDDVLTSCIVYEELCHGDVGLGQLITSNGFHTLPILLLGSEEDQKQRWMPRVTGTSPAVTAIAITEPDSGSDAAAMQSRARRADGGYRLRGQKSWISNGEVAEFTIVFAKTGPDDSPGISAFVLDKSDPGFEVGPAMKKMGQRGMICNELFFDDVFVAEDRRLGPEGEGFRGLMKAFERSRTNIAAGSVGIARASFEYARDYARTRRTFGRPIIEHQAIGFRLADMMTRIEASRLLVWQAAKLLDTPRHASVESSMAKVFASETAMFCAWGAVQTLGGWGYSREYPVERWMRDAKLDEIGEGTSEVLRMIVSRSLAKG